MSNQKSTQEGLSPEQENALRLLDPERLFRYKWEKQVNTSNRQGVEFLVYRLIPYEFIRSISLVIDPFYKYRVAPLEVVATNRVRTRTRNSVLDQRSFLNYRHVHSYATYFGGFYGVPTKDYYDPVWSFNQPDQLVLKEDFHDTTIKTRPDKQPLGSKESFTFEIRSPPRRITKTEVIDSYDAGFGAGYRSYHRYHLWRQDVGPAARLDPSALAQIRAAAATYAGDLINEHTTGLLGKLSPSRRDYTLFRNLVELKDVPRSIIQLRKTFRDAYWFYRQLTPDQIKRLWTGVPSLIKDIPKEYLGFVFGWKLLYKDAKDLLEAPAKIAKRIAYLQLRNGRDTTHRVKRDYSPYVPAGSAPSFSYDYSYMEISPSQTSKNVMEAQLRLVISARFDFPPVGEPKFANDLFLRKLGTTPSFTDLYNLIPWTWLVDWYTGLGNYLDTIEAINSDRNLINWGVVTCDVTGKLATDRRWKEERLDTLLVQNQPAVSRSSQPEFHHQSVLEYKYSVRKGLADVGVNTLENTSSLTAYQQSILGAILLSRK